MGESPGESPRELDAVVVGAGIAGIYMLYRLVKLGMQVVAIDAAPGVGGTWYWNRYPGARCDIECLDYSYSFDDTLQQEWQWSERYASQPEILRYLDHVVDRFELRSHLRLGTRVDSMHFDVTTARWSVRTDAAETVHATYCAMATGCLSTPKLIEVAGLESFGGRWVHTSRWPHEQVDFSGERVALIGTGSSGVQVLPALAAEAESVTVFMRTPPYCLPARGLSFDDGEVERRKASYPEHRERARHSFTCISDELAVVDPRSAHSVTEAERRRAFENGWAHGGLLPVLLAFDDVISDPSANRFAAEFVKSKIKSIVSEERTAESLTSIDYPLAAKRPCLDMGFYAAFNRDNVRLVDLRRTPIERITASGISTTAEEVAFDTIVLATGFDAMTGSLLKVDIRGLDGVSLRDHWALEPRCYLGVMPAGFPNLFLITGPGSPSVQSNMWCSIEQHVEWVADCIEHLRDRQIAMISARPDAEDEWWNHVQDLSRCSIYEQADSWQIGANVPGKSRVFMAYVGGLAEYREHCDSVARGGYVGFELEGTTDRDRSRSRSPDRDRVP
jgi:cation diffusion facilitator CzcD-associated flavoprotein CzcO